MDRIFVLKEARRMGSSNPFCSAGGSTTHGAIQGVSQAPSLDTWMDRRILLPLKQDRRGFLCPSNNRNFLEGISVPRAGGTPEGSTNGRISNPRRVGPDRTPRKPLSAGSGRRRGERLCPRGHNPMGSRWGSPHTKQLKTVDRCVTFYSN